MKTEWSTHSFFLASTKLTDAIGNPPIVLTVRSLLEVNKRCFHICFHISVERLQPLDFIEVLLLEAAHNPLVPGSSPGGPTIKKVTL